MTQNEILKDFLSYLEDKYDVSVGSPFYDMLYPVSENAAQRDIKIDKITLNARALTAEGEALDTKVAEQGLSRYPAEYAIGFVRIRGKQGSIIHTGAKIASSDLLFATTQSGIIPEEGYVDIEARCTTAGKVGNVEAGAINRFPVTLPGMTSVENLYSFKGGQDKESDDELRQRYFAKVSRPTASGNKNHYETWAREAPSSAGSVGTVQVLPLWNGPGTVKVIITDSDNLPAMHQLELDVLKYIEENRPIGAKVTVVSAASLNIQIRVNIVFSEGVDRNATKDKIEIAIMDYLANTALHNGYVSYAKIGKTILSVNGVEDYNSLYVNSDKMNISFDTGYVPVLQELTVNTANEVTANA